MRAREQEDENGDTYCGGRGEKAAVLAWETSGSAAGEVHRRSPLLLPLGESRGEEGKKERE